jgi:EmrB/QacA subfamily drug resistance transporter
MSQRAKVAVVVCVGVFLSSLDLFIVNIAFPDLQRDFPGGSLAELSWVLNVYAIVFAALLVPAGRWADRAGHKRAFLAGLALFMIASAACAAAPSVTFLIGARVVQAAGAALMLPTSLALLLPEFPPHRRQIAVGIWAATGGAAAAAGPPVGGLLVEGSWRLVFLVNVPLVLAALAIGVKVLRETREPAGAPPDAAGAALLAGAIGALALAIVEGPDWGWGSDRVLGLLALSILLIAAVAARSTRHPAPVVEPELLKVRGFAFAGVAIVVFFMGFGTMLLGTVLFLTSVWDQPVLTAGLMLAPGPAMVAVLAVPASFAGQRLGQTSVGVIGTLFFALGGLWWLTHMSATPDYASNLLPSLLLGGIGVALTLPSAQGAGTATLPASRLATGTAVLIMARQIGMALGVAILVAIVGTPGGAEAVGAFKDAWVFVVATAVTASLAMLATHSRPAQGALATQPAELAA